MKKATTLLLATAVTAGCIAIPVHATGSVKVLVDNNLVKFPDAQPFLDTSSRTQIPARHVSEILGGNVTWDDASKTVTIKQSGKTIVLKIGQEAMTVDGKEVKLDTAAQIKDNRTFVPLRFVSEGIGATVKWEEASLTASITTKGGVPTPPPSGDTVVAKGFVFPKNTNLLFVKDGIDFSTNVEQYIRIDLRRPNFEQQKLDLKGAIASKYGEQIGDEVYKHVLTKKVEDDFLPEKTINVASKKQHIVIFGSDDCNPTVDIRIYKPGVDSNKLN